MGGFFSCRCCCRKESDKERKNTNPRDTNIEELLRENNRLKQIILSPDQWSSLEAGILRMSGDFEDLNDKYSNTKLCERFSRIKKSEWFQFYRALIKRHKNELDVLSFLSGIMKYIYEDCKKESVERFAYGNPIQFDKTFSLIRFKKESGQTEIALENIKMVMKRKYNLPDEVAGRLSTRQRSGSLGSTLMNPSTWKQEGSDAFSRNLVTFRKKFAYVFRIIYEDPDILEIFQRFFVAIVECSWLTVVSVPPIELHFDEQILGKLLDKEMEKHFEKYPTNRRVTRQDKDVGTIIQIVWPELDDKHGSHTRGFVITVDASSET